MRDWRHADTEKQVCLQYKNGDGGHCAGAFGKGLERFAPQGIVSVRTLPLVEALDFLDLKVQRLLEP